jgi:serine/threonine protein kinase
MGEQVPILYSPEGEPLPDVRTPYFNPPGWVTDPFLEGQEATPEMPILKEGRYSIVSALSFSNSGGVYLAQDNESGENVVIKEARPYTNVDENGNEAIGILKLEFEILKMLQDDGAVPKTLDFFYEWEHAYLVEEYIKGVGIREILLAKNPLLNVNPTLSDTEKYYDCFRKIFTSFNEILKIVHNKGIILGDLSANNFIIDPDNYTIRLIDLEGAFRVGIDTPTYMHTPGFRKLQRVLSKSQDFSDDFYTMGVIMFYFLFPISTISDLKDDVFDGVLKAMLNDAGWPSKVFELINGLVEGKKGYDDVRILLEGQVELREPKYQCDVTNPEINKIIEGFGEFILNSMEANREDRLFPADPFMYNTNSLSLGFGACGVLYALKKCNFEIPDEAKLWVEKNLKRVNEKMYPPGLLTGTSGLSYTLWQLGYEDIALEMMSLTNKHEMLRKNHSLYYGDAGVGMTNLYLYHQTKNDSFLQFATALGNHLLMVAKENERGTYWEDAEGNVWLGYGYGQSGVALFLLKLFELTNNASYLECGKEALAYDLSHAYSTEDNILSFADSAADTSTFSPYLEVGTAGIIKVLLRYEMFDEIDKLVNDLARKYAVGIGLSWGLASFIDVFIDLYKHTKDAKYLEMIKKPLAGIKDIYLVKTSKGLAVPGEGMFRISCDYATGVAGVMHTLHKYVSLNYD